MASDAAVRHLATLVRLDLTESVVYTPNGGDPLTINAVIDRPGPDPLGGGQAALIHVQVLNDASIGVDLAALDAGSDTISVAERYGGTAKARRIQRLGEHDAEWVTLEVQ